MFLVKQIRNNVWVTVDCRETGDFALLANHNKWEEHNEPIRNRDQGMLTASSAGSHGRIKSKNPATGVKGTKRRMN